MQKSNATVAAGATPDDGQAAPLELSQIGTFGANEFEEGLLSTMARFQE